MQLNSIRIAIVSLVVLSAVRCVGAADSPTRAEFDKAYDQYKDIVKQCADLQDRFPIADASERPAMAEKYDALVAEGNKLRPKLLALAEKAYLENPADKQMADMIDAAVVTFIHDDDYEPALRLAKLLIENKYPDKSIYNMAGAAAFFTSNYDDAEKYLKQANENGTLDEKGKAALDEIKDYRAKWDREQRFRAAEAKADDLPRVKLTIGDAKGHEKGVVVVELFENEAPNTVANFVSLVKKKFYDGTPFHRVLPTFMAQGGDPTGTGTGGPGYRIADECFTPNHREHFRGSLSMAHTAAPDTGGSQFFLNFVPTSHLDGKHTVFGRVIDGMDVLAKITRIDPDHAGATRPDKIIKAEIVRTREHPYEPKTLKE
jgi:cyclophilin family peptidyl-prolyl cis-trans isomerase